MPDTIITYKYNSLDKIFNPCIIRCQKETKNSKEFFILPFKRHSAEIWKIGKGLGKTEQCRRFIQSNPSSRCLVVVNTRRLSKQVSKQFQIPCYLDFIDNQNDDRWEGSLVVCINSLHKVVGKVDYLFIDEAEQCLQTLRGKSLPNDVSRAVHESLVYFGSQSKRMVLMDAYASSPCADLIRQCGRIEDSVIFYCPGKERTWVDIGNSTSTHFQYIMEQVRDGKKIAIGCYSKADLHKLNRLLKNNFPEKDIKAYHADYKEDEDTNLEEQSEENDFVCDVLIYTNVIGSGISIDVEDHYDQVHVIFGKSAKMTATIGLQMSGRVRYPKNQEIYFSGSRKKKSFEGQYIPESTQDFIDDFLKKKLDAANRFYQNLNMTIPSWYRDERERKDYLHLMVSILSNDIEYGLGWATSWIRQNMNVISIEDEMVVNEEIKDECREISREIKEEAIQEINAADEISKARYLEIIKRPQLPSRAEKNSIHKRNIREAIGRPFDKGTDEERRKIIKEYIKDNDFNRLWNFSYLKLWTQDQYEAVYKAQNKQYLQRNILNTDNILKRTKLIYKILEILGVSGLQTDVILEESAMNKAFIYALSNADEFKQVGISLNYTTAKRFINAILKMVNLKTTAGKRQSKKNKNGKRKHLYNLCPKQLDWMNRITEKQRRELLDKAGISIAGNPVIVDAEDISEQERVDEEMSKTFNKCIYRKVLDASKKEEAGERALGAYAPCLPLPSRFEITEAMRPTAFFVDEAEWFRISAKRLSEGKEPTEIERWISKKAKSGEPIQFDAVGSPRRCPRRYPVILDYPCEHFLMTSSYFGSLEGKKLLSAVPKELRTAFRPPKGYRFWDFDMNRAHLTILALLSRDDAMLKWLEGDPHQETGDKLLTTVDDSMMRRKIGKAINSAIIAGASDVWLKIELEKHGICISESEAQFKIDQWWESFPKAHVYRQEHDKMIDRLVSRNEGYLLKFGKRTMFRFDKDILSGKQCPKSWEVDGSMTKQSIQLKAKRSAFTALLRAWESYLMDHIFVKAHQMDLKLACPMYDGALFLVPEDFNDEG